MARKSRKYQTAQHAASIQALSLYNTALYVRLSVMDGGKQSTESSDLAQTVQLNAVLLSQFFGA